jgi:putative Mg2+ transporter-C (MgtC) family protein
MFTSLFDQYWNHSLIQANFVIFLNLAGALLLGALLGYERAYQGRAAGMRTYGIVCMASCALTVFTGYSHFWFGTGMPANFTPDPTRVIQGIVSGIGFLCAGVIMKDGFSISGLSTAASIWMCSAIGVLVGVGFYAAAISLTLLTIFGMFIIPIVETQLPQKRAVVVRISFKEGLTPDEQKIIAINSSVGLEIPSNSISINIKNGVHIWQYIGLAKPEQTNPSCQEISNALLKLEGITEIDVQPSRH